MKREPIFLNILKNDKGGKIVLSTLGVVVFVVVFCNLFMPQDSIFYISTFTVTILGKYLAFALLALALDLVWGYLGVLSLGHGAFFALGGYAWAMYLMRQIGDRGVYGNPDLPDFMVFMNLKELPWFWQGFDNPIFAFLMVMLVPALLAFVFGYLAFKSRVTGVYLSIITQALTYALMLAFFRNDMGFGGNNGLTDFKDILGFDLSLDSTRVGLLIITFIALVIGYFICRFIMNSKLGRVIISIRDAESRVRFIGYKVEQYKLFIFIVSAVLSAIAGALYVPQVGIINPSVFSPLFSIELVIWVAVGGRGTLYGAIIGAIVVSFASTYFTSALPEVWLYALGGLFVVSTLYLPKGIVGVFEKLKVKKEA
ncbi:urea ABC transporter permease subunit UrtC [Malaciobacter molluscorum]|uniref:urea ABC transporter permease subunit UrtC n=1 Tax=Malaciobacter molluscorum TaxID=1032072 RepID=UPI00100A7C69|nr:urea ABC transporter permease subunit UrtC [Malaciobacter molluscorum]RXJ94566.1 urea ABC transporter permease subunit UrtC [Malaciobacter molluscorum]